MSGPQEHTQSTYRFASTSISSAPSPRATKIGWSRPIERMARTGEFTPPGISSSARRYNSAERPSPPANGSDTRVLALPLGVVVGEVVQADLLVLGRRGQDRAIVPVELVLVGDPVEDRVALLLGAPVGHREDGVRPVRIGGALVAVRDPTDRGHLAADLEHPVLGNSPHAHTVG